MKVAEKSKTFHTSFEDVDQMIADLTSNEAIRSEVSFLSKSWGKSVINVSAEQN